MKTERIIHWALLQASEQDSSTTETSLLSLVPLIVSLLAAGVSALALWRTHFSRGEVVYATGDAVLSVTQWTNEGRTWYTPDLIITTAIANTGVRPVVIQGLRVKVEYPDLPIPSAYETWTFNMELDPTAEIPQGPGRSAIKLERGSGIPWVVLAKASIEKRFVCWTRWETPVIQRVKLTLESKTTRSKNWVQVESWDYEFKPRWWVEMTANGSGILLVPTGQAEARYKNETHPKDLHKYTRPTEPLPKEPRDQSPSFVVRGDRTDESLSG